MWDVVDYLRAVWPAREAVYCLWQENTSSWSCCGLVRPLMCKTDRWSVLRLVFYSSPSFHLLFSVFLLCSRHFLYNPLSIFVPNSTGHSCTLSWFFLHFKYFLWDFLLSCIPGCIPDTKFFPGLWCWCMFLHRPVWYQRWIDSNSMNLKFYRCWEWIPLQVCTVLLQRHIS